MSAQQFDDHIHLMEVQGGSFVKALANCWYAADNRNKARLRAEFDDYFSEYKAKFEAMRTDEERQLEQARRAFSQNPTVEMATAVSQLAKIVDKQRKATS